MFYDTKCLIDEYDPNRTKIGFLYIPLIQLTTVANNTTNIEK